MDLKVLQYFIEVSEEKNISKVAEKHFLSQPALSLQLKKLEELYGTRLLDRNMRGVEPTEAGRVLAEKFKAIINLYDQTFEELENLKENQRVIQIETNLTLATYLMPSLIFRLNQSEEFKDCNFKLTFNTNTPVESDVLSGFSQIGLVQFPVDDSNLIRQSVVDDYLTVVAAADYDVPATISIKDLKKYPLIEVYDKLHERVELKETLLAAGIHMKELNVILSLHSTESAKTALREGIGLSILPHVSVRQELSQKQFKEVKVKGLSQKYPIYLIRSKDQKYDDTIKEVASAIKLLIEEDFATYH